MTCSDASVVSDSLQHCGLRSARLLCPWDCLSKNTGVGCHSLLQGIFMTQGSNLCLLYYREILDHWVTQEAQDKNNCFEFNIYLMVESVWFNSVTQLCLTLCDPMDCSMPGLPVLHQLPGFIQTHVHWVSDAIQPSHLLSPSLSSHLQSFPASGSFPVSQFFASGGQSIEVSASALVLQMSIQDWFPLGWTGWISLQSKGLSRVFSNTTVQKHQFFGAQLSL